MGNSIAQGMSKRCAATERERDELRAANERLKREVDYWMNLDAQALEAENERLRTVLLEARDSIAGEITFQRGGNGPWIPANADDPLLAIVEKIDATLAC